MGSFFRDQFDLYQEIKKDPAGTFSRLRRAVIFATGEDMEQDLKDACVLIGEHKDYDFAFGEVDVLWGLLRDRLSVFEGEIKK